LALAAAARLYAGGGGRRTALVFWAALGIGVLIKGPIAPMTAGLALGALFLWERRARWMAPLAHWSGPLLFVALVAPWMIAIGVATNGAFFAEAIGGDLGPKVAGGHEGHFAPPGTHTLLAPLLLFPATLGLIPAVGLAWRGLRAPRTAPEHNGVRFLLAWALPTWLVFEALPTKLVHYTLPAYPALALLCGAGLVAIFAADRPRRPWASMLLFTGVALALAALAAGASTYLPGDAEAGLRRAVQTGLIGAALALAAFVALTLSRTPGRALVVALIAALTAYTAIRERILPEARTLLVSQEAAVALTREGLLPAPGEPDARALYVVGYRETSIVFSTRTNARLWEADRAAASAAAGDAIVVNELDGSRAALEEGLAERGLAFTPQGPAIDGLNYSNGDAVRLQVGVITEPAD
jgi:4-amino-4-deoxy-L-arabinose transferase-like glycosyltransferase